MKVTKNSTDSISNLFYILWWYHYCKFFWPQFYENFFKIWFKTWFILTLPGFKISFRMVTHAKLSSHKPVLSHLRLLSTNRSSVWTTEWICYWWDCFWSVFLTLRVRSGAVNTPVSLWTLLSSSYRHFKMWSRCLCCIVDQSRYQNRSSWAKFPTVYDQ